MVSGACPGDGDGGMVCAGVGGFEVAAAFLLAPACGLGVEREVQTILVVIAIAEVAASLQRRERKTGSGYVVTRVISVVLHIGARR